MTDPAIVTWLIRTAVGGGGLLLLAWWWQRKLHSPWRQQRLGEWGVAAALVVAGAGLLPAWLLIPVTVPAPAAVATDPVAEPVAHGDVVVDALDMPFLFEPLPQVAVADVERPAPPKPAATSWHVGDLVPGVYAVAAAVVLGRWLLANLAVWWLLRKREPIPAPVGELFAEMSWPRKCQLVVTDRVDVPFSVGLWRPTVVLPGRLVDQATTEELRWVLAHELSHLERQDTRTCWLFVIAQVVYFYLPWFWWMRKRVRLAQEYLADAAAIEWAGSPADYAQFLVSWAGRPVAAGTGVSGSGSDLFRRVTMLLETKQSEPRHSRRWTIGLASGLIAVGLVVGGLGLRAVAADDEKKPAEKKEEKKPEKKRALRNFDPFGNVDKLLGGIEGLDEEQLKALRKQLEEASKQLAEIRKQLQQNPGMGLPAMPPIPPMAGFGGQGGAFAFPRGQFNAFGVRPHAVRLGAQVRSPSATLADQLDLPKAQGMVLEEVGANSAAAKAGMKAHDILLELDGKTVSNKANEFSKMIADIKADTPVDAVVLRKGKKETIKGLKLPEAKAPQAFGGFGQGFPGRPGAFGGIGGAQGGVFGGGAGGKGTSTSISRNNDEFTTAHKEGDLSITIKGKIDQGKAKVTEVVIDEGKGQKATFDSLDKVPAEHAKKVKKLVEMSAGGSIKVPAKPGDDNSF